MTTNSAGIWDLDGRMEVKMSRNALKTILCPVSGIMHCLNSDDMFNEVLDEVIPMLERHNPRSKDIVLSLNRIQIYVLHLLSRASLLTLWDYEDEMRQARKERGIDHIDSEGLLKVMELTSQVQDADSELMDAGETMLVVDQLDEALSND